MLDNNYIKIKKENTVLARARGKEYINRVKIGKIYFLRVEDVKEEDDNYVFNITDVKQLVPTISMHMKVVATKDELKIILLKARK